MSTQPQSAAEIAAAKQEAADVDRGLELYEQIKKLQAAMKPITERLTARALEGKQIPLEDPDREGMQYIAKGTNGKTVPIILTADMLVPGFKDQSPGLVKARGLADGKLESFFQKVTVWKRIAKDGKDFRRDVAVILEDKAPSFIAACVQRDRFKLPKIGIKINWSRDDEEEEGEE